MKKILILSTSYGQGHMATAQAIEEGLQAGKESVEVEIVDFTEIISTFLNKTSKKAYEDSTKYLPLLYKVFFEATDFSLPIKGFNKLSYRLSKDKIVDFFLDKNPDLIVCNSPHWQYIVSLAREDNLFSTPLVSVITDSITLHVSWALGNADGYVVPNSETAESLHQLGVPVSKIRALGYPIRLSFSDKSFDKRAFLAKKNIDATKKVVLLLAAGLRASNAIETIADIQNNNKDVQIVVITGRDKDLYPKLESVFGPTIKLIGWTADIPQYVRSCDMVITKAGGSTVMECIGSKKPVIINKIIPGQEEGNAEYITKHNLGIVALEHEMVSLATQKIFREYSFYQKNLQKHANPTASLSIARYIMKLIK